MHLHGLLNLPLKTFTRYENAIKCELDFRAILLWNYLLALIYFSSIFTAFSTNKIGFKINSIKSKYSICIKQHVKKLHPKSSIITIIKLALSLNAHHNFVWPKIVQWNFYIKKHWLYVHTSWMIVPVIGLITTILKFQINNNNHMRARARSHVCVCVCWRLSIC